ncbi:putative peptide modification system cyclase [Arenimonas composti]|uniref:Guanylate cyclase domain-containing protein n=1 Tax=Arenimonas composti TR7-09 = DSM 18010 TaxID=1121013 RepID=A0A091BCW0_9GAMM|nr:putative peptide modification system cyclase [Arenimonas composti]KFN49571.1 hypothetical protein P873_10480 [Arenimonas composti TR7-09 = DSM 18010]
MNLDESGPGDSAAPQVKPLLRTVLLADIVDSTALVERLGDMRAALLLQKHDQLLRQSIQFCHGQLIDKADGVLALFERPIQALDFALRYQRGLRELGQAEGMSLRVRIGVHVGDVMMWANEPQHVRAGAKPFEVEGLAKPVAARLMNLALPGQILMSGMAQNLCQRAVGELGEAGRELRFVLHGRYRFKGVPAPMLVHEVGEPGLSPLRAPDSGPKAWRELPLWRRPPVLALELLLVGVLVLGGVWSTLRAPPAIAFAERDWVVVADLQNRTGEALFDDSLDTALRVGLEQSRHINLVSELQIDRALARMQRPGQPVDRQLATELALREGARAVILPTVAEVGGVIRVSLEVIDPRSGVTVYSESADARDAAQVLDALDDNTRRIRGHLGEAIAAIDATSEPLEQVTTGNLEALRAFSLGVQARYRGRLDEARQLFEEAIRLDPSFAMAHLQLAFMRYVDNDATGTRHFVDLAAQNRTHLTRREQLFLDAAAATLDEPELALEKFRLLASLYPEEFRAYGNYAWFAHYDLLQTEKGLAQLTPALTPRNPRAGQAHYTAGVLNLALDRYAEAQNHFEQASLLGVGGFNREHAETFVAQRRYADAARVLALDSATGSDVVDLEMRLIDISLPLDQGDIAQATAVAGQLAAAAAGASELHRWNLEGIRLSVRALDPDPEFAADLRAHAAAQAGRLADGDVLLQRHVLFQALAAGWMAANSGDTVTAQAMLDVVAGNRLVDTYPANAGMRRALEAELALAAGDPGKAVALLKRAVTLPGASYFERAVLARAQYAAGDWEGAATTAAWLADNRGRAFAESTSIGHWQPMNVVESTLALKLRAMALTRAGRAKEAGEAAARFAAAWPDGENAAIVQRRFPAD